MRMWRRRQPVALAAFIIAVLPSHAEALGKPISAIPSSQTRPTTSERVSALLAGIPERGNELGNTNAPVTLQYFADLECPFCKQFDLKVIPALIRRYVRTGKLRIEFRAFETSTREPVIFYTQQVAALAAGRQEKLWYFVELFFHEQREDGSGYVTENYLRGLAEQVPGLDAVVRAPGHEFLHLLELVGVLGVIRCHDMHHPVLLTHRVDVRLARA